jgi:hypothetical protein
MDGVAAFQEEYSASYLATLPPGVKEILLEAFLLGYEANKADAARYRFIRDEVIQDAQGMGAAPSRDEYPMGIAIAILDPGVNLAGNHNIAGWAVAYEHSADFMVDAAMTKWYNRKGA